MSLQQFHCLFFWPFIPQTAAHLSCLVWWVLSVRTVTGCSGEWHEGTEDNMRLDLVRTNCNEAANIELILSLEDRKALNRTGMWPPTRRKIRWDRETSVLQTYTFILRFGSQSDGSPWKGKCLYCLILSETLSLGLRRWDPQLGVLQTARAGHRHLQLHPRGQYSAPLPPPEWTSLLTGRGLFLDSLDTLPQTINIHIKIRKPKIDNVQLCIHIHNPGIAWYFVGVMKHKIEKM